MPIKLIDPATWRGRQRDNSCLPSSPRFVVPIGTESQLGFDAASHFSPLGTLATTAAVYGDFPRTRRRWRWRKNRRRRSWRSRRSLLDWNNRQDSPGTIGMKLNNNNSNDNELGEQAPKTLNWIVLPSAQAPFVVWANKNRETAPGVTIKTLRR